MHSFPSVLPSLLPLVTTSDPSLRHGALYAIAELAHGLFEHAQSVGQSLMQLVGEETITELIHIVPRVSYSLLSVHVHVSMCLSVCLFVLMYIAEKSRRV